MDRSIDRENARSEKALPEILAPAGDVRSALAAFAAGADAVYLGLKHFSARMQADNFSTAELARVTDLAHGEGRRVYVALNTLLKPNDPAQALRLIRRLVLDAAPDALILQDPGLPALARQAGFEGELHLSTLANVTHQRALQTAAETGASRVILPRELSLDEVRLMHDACPDGLDLEIFVHGALCYCVSGRCWWSSYMGGKSGLRGRCVQPCRRVYEQKGRKGRFFSCLDLSLGRLAMTLLGLPRLRSWKIEGRKKGPHYVYYVASAYRLLRDEGDNPEAKKEADAILGAALGRPGTRSLFLPQSPQSPTRGPEKGKETQTSSGLLCGKISAEPGGRFALRPWFPLLPKDYVRIGYEDEPWHCTVSIPKWTPKGGAFTLPLPRNKRPKPGTPVFLIDRQEPELAALLRQWKQDLDGIRSEAKTREEDVMALAPVMPAPLAGGGKGVLDVVLRSSLPKGREGKGGIRPGVVQGLWLSARAASAVSRTLYQRISWWLPPVIWPDEEARWQELITAVLRGGGRHFVCNAPWQEALFNEKKGLSLFAGPFCNLANAFALKAMADLGYSGAFASPELGREDLLALPARSPLPLGVVLSGYWPVGISRHGAEPLSGQEGFVSPMGEEFWLRRYGRNTWLYPSWPLDLAPCRGELEKAGYAVFLHMDEHPPKGLAAVRKSGQFNWNAGVL